MRMCRSLKCVAIAFVVLFTLMQLSCAIDTAFVPVKHVDVLILGGGIAGITAARELRRKNVTNFTLLEGMDRVGGRLRSAQVANVTVELGANWIHGISSELHTR